MLFKQEKGKVILVQLHGQTVAHMWTIQHSCCLWSPSGCREGGALSECPAKVGGEWLAEVYGDLWLFSQTFIASSSVGSPERPMVSCNQRRGSCRWVHQNHCSLRLVMETNGVAEHSVSRRQTKLRKRNWRDQHLLIQRAQDFNLALKDWKDLWESWLCFTGSN